jgi:hypothetical protein
MPDCVGAEASFSIDDSKVFIVTRAQRLRAVSVFYLDQMLIQARKNGLAEDAARLDEAINWLKED